MVNLTATSKPQGTKGGGAAMSETSLPGGSSASDIIATVQSERAIDVPIEFNNAEHDRPETKKDGIREEIGRAITATRGILSEKSDCSTWFGANALAALDAFEKQLLNAPITRYSDDDQHGIKQSVSEEQKSWKTYDAQGNETRDAKIQAYRLFPTVEISQQGPFISRSSKTRIGNYAAATLESRIAQILHELAHLTFRGEDGALIKNDGPGSGVNSEDNTNLILDKGEGKGNCRNAIENYMKNLRKQQKKNI